MDFNRSILGLDGQAVDNVTLGKILAQQLAHATNVDALKFYNWAVKLYNGEELTLDESDTNTLKEYIKSNGQLTALAKAQMLQVFQ